MYPQLMTAAQKAESEQENRPRKGVWVRLAQSEGKDKILSLKQQIVQLRVAIQRSLQWTTSGNPKPLGNGGSGNRNYSNTRGNSNGQNHEGRRHLHPASWDAQPSGREPGQLVSTDIPVAEPGYHNPSPLVWLLGHANEAMVMVEGVEIMAMVDTRSQVSTLFNRRVLLRIWVENRGLLHLNGTGGILILYMGYIEGNLIIPALPWFNEDMLYLVILDNKYGERVLDQIGALVIDHLVHLSTVISKRNTVKSPNVPEYNLKGGKGKICMMMTVVIPPFATIMVKRVVTLTTYSKCVNVIVKPILGYVDHIAMARSYGVLRPGVGKVNVCLRNHSAKQITLPKQTAVGEIAVANAILSLLALRPIRMILVGWGHHSARANWGSEKNFWKKIDLIGVWSLDDQKEVQDLIVEYAIIFTIRDMDLGKTSLVKHSIRLTDNTPFKEGY